MDLPEKQPLPQLRRERRTRLPLQEGRDSEEGKELMEKRLDNLPSEDNETSRLEKRGSILGSCPPCNLETPSVSAFLLDPLSQLEEFSGISEVLSLPRGPERQLRSILKGFTRQENEDTLTRASRERGPASSGGPWGNSGSQEGLGDHGSRI